MSWAALVLVPRRVGWLPACSAADWSQLSSNKYHVFRRKDSRSSTWLCCEGCGLSAPHRGQATGRRWKMDATPWQVCASFCSLEGKNLGCQCTSETAVIWVDVELINVASGAAKGWLKLNRVIDPSSHVRRQPSQIQVWLHDT